MSAETRPSLAVALRYGREDHAPVVVASGRGHVGRKIIETAREHGVPLEENPALAEALSHIELEREIPEALYVAVAEIIGFILKASGRADQGNTSSPSEESGAARMAARSASSISSR